MKILPIFEQLKSLVWEPEVIDREFLATNSLLTILSAVFALRGRNADKQKMMRDFVVLAIDAALSVEKGARGAAEPSVAEALTNASRAALDVEYLLMKNESRRIISKAAIKATSAVVGVARIAAYYTAPKLKLARAMQVEGVAWDKLEMPQAMAEVMVLVAEAESNTEKKLKEIVFEYFNNRNKK